MFIINVTYTFFSFGQKIESKGKANVEIVVTIALLSEWDFLPLEAIINGWINFSNNAEFVKIKKIIKQDLKWLYIVL